MHRVTRARVRILIAAIGCSLVGLGGGNPASGAGPGVATIAVGDHHTCAVRTDGTVWCWGDGSKGQLGDGTTGDPTSHRRTTPVRVLRGSSALRGATKVAAGGYHSCAVRTDGGVVCWGDDTYGQLGDGQAGSSASRTTAVRVRRGSGYLTGVKRITAGEYHTCAIQSDSHVLCWGQGSEGQLGDGRSGVGHLRTSAIRVRQGNGYLTGVDAIAAGGGHTCAATSDGSAWCWGAGSVGQLGDEGSGSGHLRTSAARVRHGSGFLTRVSGIAAGPFHSCARRIDGTSWCWGWEKYGALGDATGAANIIRTLPVQVLRGSRALTHVTGIAAGYGHSCARRDDATAMCWGSDVRGQLGDGTTGDPATGLRVTAVQVVRQSGPFGGVRKLDGGLGHTCALRTDGTAWCWGSNDSGQLGRGSADDDPHPYPIKVPFP